MLLVLPWHLPGSRVQTTRQMGAREEISPATLRGARGKSLTFAENLLVYLKPVVSGSHTGWDLQKSRVNRVPGLGDVSEPPRTAVGAKTPVDGEVPAPRLHPGDFLAHQRLGEPGVGGIWAEFGQAAPGSAARAAWHGRERKSQPAPAFNPACPGERPQVPRAGTLGRRKQLDAKMFLAGHRAGLGLPPAPSRWSQWCWKQGVTCPGVLWQASCSPVAPSGQMGWGKVPACLPR